MCAPTIVIRRWGGPWLGLPPSTGGSYGNDATLNHCGGASEWGLVELGPTLVAPCELNEWIGRKQTVTTKDERQEGKKKLSSSTGAGEPEVGGCQWLVLLGEGGGWS